MSERWTPGRFRIAGIAALVGGILWIVPYGGLARVMPEATPLWVAGILGVAVPAALTMVGVLAVRARWGEQLHRWGRLGNLALLIGLLCVGTGSVAMLGALPAFDAPLPDRLGPVFWVGVAVNALGMLLQVVGSLFLGLSL